MKLKDPEFREITKKQWKFIDLVFCCLTILVKVCITTIQSSIFIIEIKFFEIAKISYALK